MNDKFLIVIYDFRNEGFEHNQALQYRIADQDELEVLKVKLEDSGNHFEVYAIGNLIFSSTQTERNES